MPRKKIEPKDLGEQQLTQTQINALMVALSEIMALEGKEDGLKLALKKGSVETVAQITGLLNEVIAKANEIIIIYNTFGGK